MSTTTLLGQTVRNNGSTIMGAGKVSSGDKVKALSLKSNATNVASRSPVAYLSWQTGISSLLQSSGSALTNPVVQSSTTGFCKIPLNSHGWSVGQIVIVLGQSVTSYNQIHRVTSVIDANNVQTDVRYVSDSSTAGTYKTPLGYINSMQNGKYIAAFLTDGVAGTANSSVGTPASDFFRVPYGVSRGDYGYGITTWDYVTGEPTFNANRGVRTLYHNISDNNDNLEFEPYPTRAVPGSLVYFAGFKTGGKVEDFNPITG